jgi:hypothetical protein
MSLLYFAIAIKVGSIKLLLMATREASKSN